MKRMICILLAVILLAGMARLWSVYREAASCRTQNRAAAQTIRQLQQEASPELVDLQEDLALWYNLELKKQRDPQSLVLTYDGILDWGGSSMGYIEFPESEVLLPVFHGDGESLQETGLTHIPQSGFPVGSQGNHCVLLGQTGLTDGDVFFDISDLEAGDTFILYVLQERLVYRVEETKTCAARPDCPAAEPGQMLCTLIIRDGAQWAVIRGRAAA